MQFYKKTRRSDKKMAIVTSYFSGETYGLLGPQMAATIIQDNTPYECMVVAVGREDDKACLKKALADYFGIERPVIGFSTLSGRDDLFSFAKQLKDEGAITILAGPQAGVDYLGERGWRDYPHRFQGLSKNFTFSLHGPAEQAINILQNMEKNGWKDTPGLLYIEKDYSVIQNPVKAWEEYFLRKVKWNNIYRIGEGGFTPVLINKGQVLQQIGCPHAARAKWVEIDYPVFLCEIGKSKVSLLLKGCGFCDVAADKGFYGTMDISTVINQVQCLPEAEDGRKIPFELINENPLPGLPGLLKEIREREIRISQVKLTLRADWFLIGERELREALHLAEVMDVRIVLTSVGFESFDDGILKNLNKGLNVDTNLRAIRLMRQLKEEFPEKWGYSRSDGAIHGFIHPTPWDTKESSDKIKKITDMYSLPTDILPDHSTPLIIHHASGLGEWIREIEKRESVQFERHVSIIGWWRYGDRFVL